MPRGFFPDLSDCVDSNFAGVSGTPESTDPKKFRHFLVDSVNDIMYFCDNSLGERTIAGTHRMKCLRYGPAEDRHGEREWNGEFSKSVWGYATFRWYTLVDVYVCTGCYSRLHF